MHYDCDACFVLGARRFMLAGLVMLQAFFETFKIAQTKIVFDFIAPQPDVFGTAESTRTEHQYGPGKSNRGTFDTNGYM
jgi:hypothetical protein